MTSPVVAHRSRRHGPRLFEGPVVFKRSRRKIVELAALVWLLAMVVRLARSFLEAPGRGREESRAEEGS
jgi:hypothetical protein